MSRTGCGAPVEGRFWSKVDRRGPDECWLWTAARDHRGYGRFHFGHRRMVLAHRFAFRLANLAAPPDEMHVCHRCDNPPCCNPAHLFLGDDAANVADMVAKGRGVIPNLKGEALTQSKLNDAIVRQIRAEYRRGDPVFGARPLARRFGVSQPAVQFVLKGLTWKHVAEAI